jgi:hypothetical protein
MESIQFINYHAIIKAHGEREKSAWEKIYVCSALFEVFIVCMFRADSIMRATLLPMLNAPRAPFIDQLNLMAVIISLLR